MKIYKVIIVNTNVTILCKEGESILQAMCREGVRDIIYGCYGGGCGQCKIKMIEGTYLILKKMSRAHISKEDENNKKVLACCVQPSSDVHIQII